MTALCGPAFAGDRSDAFAVQRPNATAASECRCRVRTGAGLAHLTFPQDVCRDHASVEVTEARPHPVFGRSACGTDSRPLEVRRQGRAETRSFVGHLSRAMSSWHSLRRLGRSPRRASAYLAQSQLQRCLQKTATNISWWQARRRTQAMPRCRSPHLTKAFRHTDNRVCLSRKTVLAGCARKGLPPPMTGDLIEGPDPLTVWGNLLERVGGA